MRKYIRCALYLLAALCLSAAYAGSYEDFFRSIKEDDDEIVQSLLQRGFDPNTPSPDGLHGLFMAIREPSPKVAAVLIAWPKTNIEARTPKDESPLMLAALKGQAGLVRQLVARGADINKPGWAPLHYAATAGSVEIIELLLEQSAFIDAESPNGTTPLMMAAMYGSPDAVKLLLDEGADLAMKNQQGLTALDFARRGSRPDSVKLIEARLRNPKPIGPLGPEAAAAALRAQGQPVTGSTPATGQPAAVEAPKAMDVHPVEPGNPSTPVPVAPGPLGPKRQPGTW
jgi:ankyrin repeat protein